ncbi:MAG: hypothetical protein ACW99G_23890 [Candidatus Thorarchaeota archaeon]|jgi:hypothetical protein
MCDNTEEISGFINALSSFSKYLSSDMLNQIELSGLRFILMSSSFSYRIEEEIDIAVFQDFPKFLVDQEILKLNCGKYVECDGCPNRDDFLPLRAMTTELDLRKDGGPD